MEQPVLYSRHDWQDPSQPVTGPSPKDTRRHVVIHWEGNLDRHSAPSDVAGFLRDMQSSYLSSRGYSLGYNVAVVSDVDHPDDGTIWEVRGIDINNAANSGSKVSGNVNDWTSSVLLVGSHHAPASPKAATAVQWWVSFVHKSDGTDVATPWPHSQVEATACCGDYYRADIDAGRFTPPPSLIPPPQPIERPIMAAISPVRILQPTVCEPGSPVFVDTNIVVDRPDWAAGALVNVTMSETTGAGYTVVWDGNEPVPGTSNNNYLGGDTDSNLAAVRLNDDGWFAVQAFHHGGIVIVDLQGWTS